MSADTALMPIPGTVDPVPVSRAAAARADGKTELVGLPKDGIRLSLEEGGLEPKQAKLRAKQIWHWIYNRGATGFEAMTDIAKAQKPWLGPSSRSLAIIGLKVAATLPLLSVSHLLSRAPFFLQC